MLNQLLGKSRSGSIGLEFAVEELHMVQLARRGDGIAVRAQTLVDYALPRDTLLKNPDDCRDLIRAALKSGRFDGRRVISVLPAGNVRILPVTYQAAGKNEDEGEVILEAVADRLQGDVNDYVIDYMPIRGQKGDRERIAMVVVAREEQVMSYLNLLAHCGLDVVALDVGPMAIRRLVSTLAEAGRGENVLVINFGHKFSFLTMISGRRLLFDTEIGFGEAQLIEMVASALDMEAENASNLVRRHGLLPGAEAGGNEIAGTLREILKPKFLDLIDDIHKALVYAASESRGEPVRHVYMLGSVARWPGTAELLGEMLTLEIQNIPDPLQAFAPTKRRRRTSVVSTRPEMAVATGLALRGIGLEG